MKVEVGESEQLVYQVAQILARADGAGRTGKNVVKDKGRDGKARGEWSHAVADDDVDTTTDKHAAAFHIDGAHGKAEEHDAKDEPGSGFTDGMFGDASGVEHGGGEITENDGRAAPIADKGKGYGGGNDNLQALG